MLEVVNENEGLVLDTTLNVLTTLGPQKPKAAAVRLPVLPASVPYYNCKQVITRDVSCKL